MVKQYTFNDVVWYLTEIGANDNFSLKACKYLLDKELPKRWEDNIKITTYVCNILNSYMKSNDKADLHDLIEHTTSVLRERFDSCEVSCNIVVEVVEQLLYKELKFSENMIDNLFYIFECNNIANWQNDTALVVEFFNLIIAEIKHTNSDNILHWVNLSKGLELLVKRWNNTEF